MNTLVTHSLYVKLSKNSKDYGEPDITYQLAGCAEQRPLGIPMGDDCSASARLCRFAQQRTTTARHSRFLRPFSSKRLLRRRADDAVGNFETENQVFLQKAQAVHQARVQEDDVWQKSQVDPVVKQLEAADKQQDAYMTALRYINDGYAALPDGDSDVTPVQPE